MSADGTALREVVLVGLPVPLHARSEERHEELLREFAHVAHAAEGADIPKRLLRLVAQVRERYAPMAGEARKQILAARASGRPVVDVRYRVPESAREVARALSEGFDEADAFCRSGALLTLAAPPELVRFRRWLFGEFERQLGGAEPVPWQAYASGAEAQRAGEG